MRKGMIHSSYTNDLHTVMLIIADPSYAIISNHAHTPEIAVDNALTLF